MRGAIRFLLFCFAGACLTCAMMLLVVFALEEGVAHAAAPPFVTAIGNVQAVDDCAPARSTVRIIVAQWYPADYYRSCAENATRTGHRLILVVQWRNCWSLRADRRRLRQVLRTFPPAWAYALGNEQELASQGGLNCRHARGATPRRYARVWRTLEPILRRREPRALRVAGEVSPWGVPFLTRTLRAGLPGAQVIADHPYPIGAPSIMRAFVRLSRRYRLRAWADEAMCGPGAWQPLGCIPGRVLQHQGYALGGEWFSPSHPTLTTIGGTEQ